MSTEAEIKDWIDCVASDHPDRGDGRCACNARHYPEDRPNWEGWPDRECGDHRTVGYHRAWCFDCSEWCYPGERAEDGCAGCREPAKDSELTRLRAAVSRVRELLAQADDIASPDTVGPFLLASDVRRALDGDDDR